MVNVFDDVKRAVPVRDAAELYGYHPNRAGFIKCPFHIGDHTASLKLYPGAGGWHCFGCNCGGSVIDFVAQLFGLDLMGAVRKLDADFNIHALPDRPPSREECEQVKHRLEINDTYRLFEEWRSNMIQRLNQCFLKGHLAMKSLETPADFDRLTDAHALAIREQAHMEYLSDILISGTMAEQMAIFRERGQIGQLCNRILSDSPTKFGAA